MGEGTISILIVDDHPMFREGAQGHPQARPALRGRRRGEGNGREGVLAAQEHKPDMALVDISLPDINGIRLTRDLRHILPQLKVIIVSMHSKIEHIAEAFKAGASGYLVKESASEGLLKGLAKVVEGDYFLDSSVSPTVVESLMHAPLQKWPSQGRRLRHPHPARTGGHAPVGRKASARATSPRSSTSAPRPLKTTAPTS